MIRLPVASSISTNSWGVFSVDTIVDKWFIAKEIEKYLKDKYIAGQDDLNQILEEE